MPLWNMPIWVRPLWVRPLGQANLVGANLVGATLNFNSHHLLAEILYRAAGDDLFKQALALLVRQHNEWCWERWLSDKAPHHIGPTQWQTVIVNNREWALTELATWVQDGDNAPAVLRERVKAGTPTDAAIEATKLDEDLPG